MPRIAYKGLFGVIVLSLALLPTVGINADEGTKTTAVSFLKIGVGSRPQAMGGAQVADPRGGLALFWNPAGLGQGRGRSLLFSYNRYRFDSSQGLVVFSGKIGSKGGFGLGANYLRVRDIEVRSGPTDQPERTTEASDLAVYAGYGLNLPGNLSLGLAGKFIQEKLHEDKASTFAFDAGMGYGYKNLSLGAAVQNLSQGLKFREESFHLPTTIRAGAALFFLEKTVTVAADIEQLLFGCTERRLHFGAELALKALRIRGGYNYEFGGKRFGDLTGLTLGIGFGCETWELDYAVAPSENMGNAQQVSMSILSPFERPRIYVTAPADGDTVYQERVKVEGFVKSQKKIHSVQIIVNNRQRGVLVIRKEKFSQPVQLKDGPNVIRLVAQDIEGLSSEESINVVLGLVSTPNICIDHPKDGDVSYGEYVDVKGYADDDEGIEWLQIFVNDEKYWSKRVLGKKFFAFSKSVKLDRQSNRIEVITFNTKQGKSSAMVTVEKEERELHLRENWAFLIGVNEYQHWPKLTTAVRDVRVVRELLISKYGFREINIVELYNEQATRQTIIDSLTSFARKLGPSDNLFVYYAGHGEYDETLRMGYWIPTEAGYEVSSYLENAVLQNYIAAIPVQHIFVVVDACYSGTLFAERGRGIPPTHERYFQEVNKRKSRQVLTSGGREPVTDVGFDNHSIFAYYFLKALRENTQKYVTANSIFEEIKIPVANNSDQTPICKHLKNTGDEGGEFIFVRRK